MKNALFAAIATAIFTALTIIALRVLCTEQYTKSGIITLHVNLTDALFNQPTSPPPTLAPHLSRITRDPGLLQDIQNGASSALSAVATGTADGVGEAQSALSSAAASIQDIERRIPHTYSLGTRRFCVGSDQATVCSDLPLNLSGFLPDDIPSLPDAIEGALPSDASLDDPPNARRHGIVYSTNTAKRPQLARPQDFPINARGPTKSGDPWHDFEEGYRLRFGLDHRVTVAERKTSPYDIVAVRSFSGAMDDAQVQMLQSVQHHNFARTLDVFRAADSTYVLSEHAHVSLHEMSRSRAEITKVELAAILGQLVNGLAYLSLQGLEHGSLSRSNTLVTMDGVVKIGRIAMEMMQGGQTEDMDTIGVRDLSTWDPDAASFLAETTSATSPDELKKHPLLQLPWKAHHLRRQVAITMLTVRIGLSL
ncbi:hypothetical protein E8E11_002997 [Didymella keratinophila]|nr:hypothetical protein E8E11_002997 [Didymella keratinophila]